MRGPWNHLERATFGTCEPDLSGWFVHPAETASALAYIVVAFIVWSSDRPVDRRLPGRYLPPILIGIAFSSVLFHATFAAVFQGLDLAAIFLLTGHLLTTMLVGRGYIDRRYFARSFALLGVGSGLLPGLHVWAGFAGLIAQTVAVLWLGHRDPSSGPRSDYRAGVWLLLPGAGLLALDHGQVACIRGWLEHFIQPHVGWHLLSAASLLFFCRYARQLERTWSVRESISKATEPPPAASGWKK